jgi:ribosomal-protein-alanine acetyltransferase
MDPAGSSSAATLSVARARLKDLPDLIRIETACFDGDRLSPRSFRRHCKSPRSDLFLARDRSRALGYALVFHRTTSGVGRLYSIAATPEARGQGVAGALMARCEKASKARGMRAMRLEVRADNAPAIALYTKRGYAPFGRYASYYEDGEDALRMEKPLNPGTRTA